MDNLSLYSQLVSQASQEQESEFEKKAQEEQQKVEEQESKNSSIEGIIAPFGAEAIKQAGGRLGGAAFKKLGLRKTGDFVEDLAKNPRKAVGQLYQNARQEAESRIRNVRQGTRSLTDRVRQGGVNFRDEAENTIRNRIPQLPEPSTTAQAQATRPKPEVPEVKPEATARPPEPQAPEPEDPFSFRPWLSRNQASSETPSEIPLARSGPQAVEVDPFKVSTPYDDIIDDVAAGRTSLLDGVIKGSIRAPTKALSPRITELQGKLSSLRPQDVPSSIDNQTVRGLSSRIQQQAVDRTPQQLQNSQRLSPPSQTEIQTQPRASPSATEPPTSQPGQEPVGSGEGDISAEIQSGRANLTQAGALNATQENLERNATEQVERQAAGAVEKKVVGEGFEDGVKSALAANAADLENPVGDVIELGLGIASLVGSLWGTKVHHADVAKQIPNINPSLGFGIKSE